jgi:2-polyprenyl-3-methyl-5-hydroxy-6-metoxy-1,4-benzoquinol methylase
MRSEWDDPQLVEPWAAAMGDEGDYWRQVLINPLVLSIAARIAAGGDAFAGLAWGPLLRALRGEESAAALTGVRVLDLGCGEGCLGRVLAARGADYVGLDSSARLLEIGRARARAAGFEARMRFSPAELEQQAATALAGAGPASLVTAHIVLDHLSDVTSLLAALAAFLREQPGEVPLLCLTLAPERFEEARMPAAGPGEVTLSRRGLIESCQRDVMVWLRSRRIYERAFRDAGLFVRRCEPLFFHRQHAQAAPEQRDDASRRPVFWAWLLSARRGQAPAGEAAEGVRWPADSDAEGLRESVERLGSGAGATRIFDFRPGEHIIRVHNMGGELYGVLAGTAKMMDHGQELMTFRAGEVLGDLETPDGSGQCGSFPFDVMASEEGCRVALFTEEISSAVLAQSRDVGSRFFRLLRDRLRLALWHYDIREIVGEYLDRGSERLEKRLLHRCARALLWANAIEGRGRGKALGQEVAFLDPETIARRFKPGTERIDFGVVIRQLHLLRMIDAFPGAALRKEEESRAGASWDALVAHATRRYLLGEGVPQTAYGPLLAHAGRLRVGGQLTKDGNRTRQFQDVVDDLEGLLRGRPEGAAALARWSAFIARAHRFWEDRNPWLVVLRDVPALRRIALGDAAGIEDTLAARADYLLAGARRPTWEMVTAQTVSARRQEYIAVFDDFVAADLTSTGRLAFSSEGAA